MNCGTYHQGWVQQELSVDVTSSHRSVSDTEIISLRAEIDNIVGHLDVDLKQTVEILQNNASKTDNEDSVFHYTNDNGLEGILSSKRLRISDIFTLNDPSELLYGLKIFSDYIKAQSLPGGSVFASMLANLEQLKSPETLRNISNFYVLSLSWHENDLGQWRSYADNGRGFAIEFDRKILDDACLVDIPKMNTFPISYDTALLKTTMEKIAADALSLGLQLTSGYS